MHPDQVKILAHLSSRKRAWVNIEEIRGAWEFDDFDAAIKSLLSAKMIAGGSVIKLTAKGRKALKEM